MTRKFIEFCHFGMFSRAHACYTAILTGEKTARYFVNKCRNGIYNLNAVAIKNR